jgi:tetratricopeptide (TPR) repeat protein
MTDRRQSRFDVDALRRLAGDKVFARGQTYHRDGLVEIISVGPGGILAQVAGAEDYRTQVKGGGADIGGACSCAAFESWGFCKHMVAAALAANALGDGDGQEDGALGRIREHLGQQDIEVLVELILDVAERDPAVFRRLDMAAAAVRADDKTLLTRLRRIIDRATRTGGQVHYREAPDWAAGVDAVLDTLAELASGPRAGVALQLAERSIDRIEIAAGSIDDSDGHCGALLHRCREIHLAAASAARPDPIRLARDLFARETRGEYDTFEGAAALYAEVLGHVGLVEFRRLAVEAWAKLPPRSGRISELDSSGGDYRRLSNILDAFAERDGDIDARIALRAKDLSSPWAYLQLAEFCLSHGRQDEAIRRAEEGLWEFEDGRQDERLVCFTAGLLSKAKRREEAEALLRRAFEKMPSLELYAQLRKFGRRARDWAIEFLRLRLTREAQDRWHNSADLLVRVLMHERDFEQAWATVRDHRASTNAKEELARASATAFPREAVEVYADRVDRLANSGGNPAYVEAVALIARMGALRSSAEQAGYVAALKLRFSRKRNFMTLLG